MLDLMPLDVLFYIIRLLPAKDLITLTRVNRPCHFALTYHLYRLDPENALAWGVYHGLKRTVQYSLDIGADCDGSALFPVLTTVLERREKAVSGGLCRGTPKQYDEIFWLLIRRGANPNLALGRGQPAIYEAAKTGNEVVLRWLINRKDSFRRDIYNPADIPSPSIPKGVLHVNTKFRKGTLLHAAARSGSLAVTRLLLSIRANVKAMDKDGATPLHLAVRYTGLEANMWERKAVVGLLINLGSDINIKEKTNGWNLIHSACAGKVNINTEGPMIRMVEHLMALHIDINEKDSKGRTTLNVAEERLDNHRPERMPFFNAMFNAITDQSSQNPWGVTEWEQTRAILLRGSGQPRIFER
jgi:ankyrin repeat protein